MSLPPAALKGHLRALGAVVAFVGCFVLFRPVFPGESVD